MDTSPRAFINMGEEHQLIEPIVKAIRNSNFNFRTPDGIASVLTDLNPDISISPDTISKTLRDSPVFIRASSLNREGKPLYAVRSDYLTDSGLIKSAVSTLLGIVA